MAQDPYTTINRELRWSISIMYCFYAVLLAAIIHNIVRFVIGQKRYRFFHIAYFYILVTLVVVVRVIWFSFIFIVTEKTIIIIIDSDKGCQYDE